MGYPDVEEMLIAWLPTSGTVQAGHVSVSTPPDPAGSGSWLPFVRVQRVGGPRAQGIDTARVILEFFAPDRPTAADLGNAVSALFDGPILSCRNQHGAVIGAQTDSAPSWVPYDDVNVTRYQSHHTLVVHSMA
jgi:hypothetical protein